MSRFATNESGISSGVVGFGIVIRQRQGSLPRVGRRRDKAREARERGSSPSAEGDTTGASKQRHKVDSKDHNERLEAKKRGKQESVRQKSPESTTGYRDTPEKSGRGTRSGG